MSQRRGLVCAFCQAQRTLACTGGAEDPDASGPAQWWSQLQPAPGQLNTSFGFVRVQMVQFFFYFVSPSTWAASVSCARGADSATSRGLFSRPLGFRRRQRLRAGRGHTRGHRRRAVATRVASRSAPAALEQHEFFWALPGVLLIGAFVQALRSVPAKETTRDWRQKYDGSHLGHMVVVTCVVTVYPDVRVNGCGLWVSAVGVGVGVTRPPHRPRMRGVE